MTGSVSALLAKVDQTSLKRQLIKHEGRRPRVYFDTKGIPSIAIGRNLRDRGLLDDEIELLYKNDVEDHAGGLYKHLPWIDSLDRVRLAVLIDMSFMGVNTLLTFRRFLNAVKHGEYELAAEHMLDSLWATQVGSGPGQRAHTLSEMMRTGVSPFV